MLEVMAFSEPVRIVTEDGTHLDLILYQFPYVFGVHQSKLDSST